MNKYFKKFVQRLYFLCTVGIFLSISLQAQIEMHPSVISFSGGYSEGDNMTISWTLGELAITTLQGENLILTQGFQQTLNIGTGTSKNEISCDISVYPNPVNNEINILFNLRESKDFLLEIQDVTGRTIMHQSHENVNPGDLVILNASGFASGVYFLRILSKDFHLVKVSNLRKL